MELNSFLIFIHVLCLVFWLGTDVGVFVLGKFAQRSEYPSDLRLLLLKIAMILDMFPRLCMVLMIPTGYQLAVNIGAINPAAYLTPAVWIFASIWLVIVITGLLQHGTNLGVRAKTVEKFIHYFLFILGSWAGLASLVSSAPISMQWLAIKVLFFVLIIAFVLFLEKVFNPVADAFMKLAQEGSSPELESQIRKGMDRTYVWVIAIYVAVLLSAYFGVAKPVF